MLSNLSVSHAPSLLSHVLAGRPQHSQMWNHWRGRYGLSEAQQEEIWRSVDPAAQYHQSSPLTRETEEKAEKVKIRFRTWEEEVRDVEGVVGQSLLELGKANELPSLEGVCGGNLGESRLQSLAELIETSCRVRDMPFVSALDKHCSPSLCATRRGARHAGLCGRLQGRRESAGVPDQSHQGLRAVVRKWRGCGAA